MRRAVLALLLAAVWPYHLTAQAAPELPRAVPSTTMPVQTGTVRTVAAGADVQAAITAAQPGDVIEFPCAGQTYQGGYTLPNKGASTSWIVLRSTCAAQVPEGTRMDSAKAAVLRIPRFIQPSGAPVFETEYGAHHYRFIGLEVAGGYPGGSGNTLFALGSDTQTLLAQVAHHLVLDRLYMHGTATGTLRRAVALNSASTAIIESTCTEIHEAGADNQCIIGWTGPGPYLIRNSHLESGGEIIMFGGGDPAISGLVPCDLTVTGNHLTRPVSWRGSSWSVKNLFELKNACRVLVDGNVMENNWAAGQVGDAVVLKSTNQGGTCPWCGTTHVTVRRNVIRNAGGAFNLAASPDNDDGVHPAEPMHDLLITDNVLANFRTEVFTGRGQAWILQQNIARLTISHNTVVNATPIGTLILSPWGSPLMQQLRFTDNVSTSATDNYGIYGDNTGLGSATLEVYAPTAVVTGNVFGAMRQRGLDTYTSLYPPGNAFAATTGPLGFTDSTIVQRLDSVSVVDLLAAVRLRPGSLYAGKASDGKDPGADIAAVLAATAGAVEGASVTPTPVPVPVPLPTITLAQLRAAITAIDKVVGPTGRESKAIKAALAPVAVYLHALLGATP